MNLIELSGKIRTVISHQAMSDKLPYGHLKAIETLLFETLRPILGYKLNWDKIIADMVQAIAQIVAHKNYPYIFNAKLKRSYLSSIAPIQKVLQDQIIFHNVHIRSHPLSIKLYSELENLQQSIKRLLGLKSTKELDDARDQLDEIDFLITKMKIILQYDKKGSEPLIEGLKQLKAQLLTMEELHQLNLGNNVIDCIIDIEELPEKIKSNPLRAPVLNPDHRNLRYLYDDIYKMAAQMDISIVVPVQQAFDSTIDLVKSQGECFGYGIVWTEQILTKQKRIFGIDINNSNYHFQPIYLDKSQSNNLTNYNHFVAFNMPIYTAQRSYLNDTHARLKNVILNNIKFEEVVAVNYNKYHSDTSYLQKMLDTVLGMADNEPEKVFMLSLSGVSGNHAIFFHIDTHKTIHFFDAQLGYLQCKDKKKFRQFFSHYYKSLQYDKNCGFHYEVISVTEKNYIKRDNPDPNPITVEALRREIKKDLRRSMKNSISFHFHFLLHKISLWFKDTFKIGKKKPDHPLQPEQRKFDYAHIHRHLDFLDKKTVEEQPKKKVSMAALDLKLNYLRKKTQYQNTENLSEQRKLENLPEQRKLDYVHIHRHLGLLDKKTVEEQPKNKVSMAALELKLNYLRKKTQYQNTENLPEQIKLENLPEQRKPKNLPEQRKLDYAHIYRHLDLVDKKSVEEQPKNKVSMAALELKLNYLRKKTQYQNTEKLLEQRKFDHAHIHRHIDLLDKKTVEERPKNKVSMAALDLKLNYLHKNIQYQNTENLPNNTFFHNKKPKSRNTYKSENNNFSP